MLGCRLFSEGMYNLPIDRCVEQRRDRVPPSYPFDGLSVEADVRAEEEVGVAEHAASLRDHRATQQDWCADRETQVGK